MFLSTPPGRTTEKWPPLGLLYIASSLKEERGDQVVVCDAFCADMGVADLVGRAVRERPDVVGLNCSTHTFMEAIQALERVHLALPQAKIVLGGYHATFTADKILAQYPFIDYILKGEAERSLVKLLDRLEAGREPSDVEGISYLRKGGMVDNPVQLIEDLDSLPFPERSLLGDLRYGYTHQGIPLTFGKFTTISSSRGCPFKCTYCSCAAFSLRQWRPRGAEGVVEELESIYSEGYESCVFVDDNFTHNPKRATRICELIKERRIRMQLYCEGRADSASKELMRCMKGAGFDVMYFGAESASERILDYYKKHITPERTAKAIANAKEAGMLVVTSYILGAPVEGEEDVRRTIEFIRASRPHAVQVNILDCLVGTGVWEQMCQEGRVGAEDWKTNHRIYEYDGLSFGQERLEGLVADAYSEWLRGWWGREGIKDLARVLMRNHTARRIVFSNLLNRHVREQLRQGIDHRRGKLDRSSQPSPEGKR